MHPPLSHLHPADTLFALLHDMQGAATDCDDPALAEIAIEAALTVADAIRDQGEAETEPLYDDAHELDRDDLAPADEVL